MNIVIIEDELNAQEYLTKLLMELRPHYQVQARLTGVEESLNWLSANLQPDLIFMDIQLSDGISFEIFKHLKIQSPIVFTTAYDEYAIDAFKVNSIDYLLKPVHREDLQRALLKLEAKTSFFASQHNAQLRSILTQMDRQPRKNRCLVKKGDHFEYILVKDIAIANSSESLTFLHTFKGDRHLYNSTIEALINTLDQSVFFQISRSQIVNIHAIAKVFPYFNQRLKLDLNVPAKGIEVIVTRSNVMQFKEWMDA